VRELAGMHSLAYLTQPPDVTAALSPRFDPGRPGAVVRFSAEMLGTSVMQAYPWSREHGWSARN
jgi:hypothetical protein